MRPNSISVELVPDPDKTAKTTHWREGGSAGPTPTEQPPQPPAEGERWRSPRCRGDRADQRREEDEPRPEGSPMLLDLDSLVDAAAADLTRKIDHAFAKKPQKQHASSSDRCRAATCSCAAKAPRASRRLLPQVIAALMKTRPGPFALWGRVLVSFEISRRQAELRAPAALERQLRARRRRGRRHPQGALRGAAAGFSPDERTYIIDYIFAQRQNDAAHKKAPERRCERRCPGPDLGYGVSPSPRAHHQGRRQRLIQTQR